MVAKSLQISTIQQISKEEQSSLILEPGSLKQVSKNPPIWEGQTADKKYLNISYKFGVYKALIYPTKADFEKGTAFPQIVKKKGIGFGDKMEELFG